MGTRGVVPSQDIIPLQSFHPMTELLPGVVLSQNRMTPRDSFYLRTERLPWSRFILGLNDSTGVVLSQEKMTPMESFYPRTE